MIRSLGLARSKIFENAARSAPIVGLWNASMMVIDRPGPAQPAGHVVGHPDLPRLVALHRRGVRLARQHDVGAQMPGAEAGAAEADRVADRRDHPPGSPGGGPGGGLVRRSGRGALHGGDRGQRPGQRGGGRQQAEAVGIPASRVHSG
jgi:hypothetical protein